MTREQSQFHDGIAYRPSKFPLLSKAEASERQPLFPDLTTRVDPGSPGQAVTPSLAYASRSLHAPDALDCGRLSDFGSTFLSREQKHGGSGIPFQGGDIKTGE